jgi:hypothetical protein
LVEGRTSSKVVWCPEACACRTQESATESTPPPRSSGISQQIFIAFDPRAKQNLQSLGNLLKGALVLGKNFDAAQMLDGASRD